MFILKLLLKLIVLPLALIVSLIKWAGVFLTSASAAIFIMFSVICLMIAGLGYLMGVETASEAGSVVVIAFVSFMLPVVAGWLVMKIDALNEMLWDVVRS